MIVMSAPWGAPTKVIVVRDPDLSDRKKLDSDATFKTAMDGTIYSRRRTIQPYVISWSFTSLARLKAQELRDFVVSSAGLEIRLVDFNGDTWRGKATMSSYGFTTTGTGLGAIPEFVSMSFEFEGAKQ